MKELDIYGNIENSQVLLKESREAGNSCLVSLAFFKIKNSDGNLRGKLSHLCFQIHCSCVKGEQHPLWAQVVPRLQSIFQVLLNSIQLESLRSRLERTLGDLQKNLQEPEENPLNKEWVNREMHMINNCDTLTVRVSKNQKCLITKCEFHLKHIRLLSCSLIYSHADIFQLFLTL